jgi:hypothetical protein
LIVLLSRRSTVERLAPDSSAITRMPIVRRSLLFFGYQYAQVAFHN